MHRRLALPPLVAAGVGALLLANPASAGPQANRFTPGLHLTADFPYGLVQAEPSVQVMPDTGGKADDRVLEPDAAEPDGRQLHRRWTDVDHAQPAREPDRRH